MAIYGTLGESSIGALDESISGTAVDVFVYDTSQDSDGGAWRKRTQHTSWYSETLNTSTRGSRKEFPGVAIIVAESGKVIIYDGDDPDMPMWMEFTSTSGEYGAIFNGRSPVSVVAKNGEISVADSLDSIVHWNFITDTIKSTISSGSWNSNRNIKGRNPSDSTNLWQNYDNGRRIVGYPLNDLAITVLPNAPVNYATGLPVPTIAVATDDGISTIKDDGTVASTQRGTNETHSITFDEDYSQIFSWGTTDGFPRHITRLPIVSWSNSSTSSALWTNNYFSGSSEGAGAAAASTGTADGGVVTVANSGRHFGIEYGSGGNPDDRLVIFHPLNMTNNANQNLSAWVTSSYNTGYMHGDIKGAFLSGISTTNAVAKYYDDFANNDKGWSFADNGSSGISGGNLIIEQNSNARATDGDALNGVATGTKLTIILTVSGSGNGNLILDDDGAGAGLGGNTNYGLINATGSYTFTVNKTASNKLRFIRSTGSNNYEINFINISTEYDRSVNDKGLQVFGTITKSPVATGADLVAYSGFSASNYLLSSMGSLNIGINDLCIMFWYKRSTGSEINIFVDDLNDGSAAGFRIVPGNNVNDIYLSNGDFSVYQVFAGKAKGGGQWAHITVVKNYGADIKVYQDGIFVGTNTSLASVNLNSGGHIRVYGTPDASTYISLLRIGYTLPSAEQIKKIYEDEKVLFQENAKCTLHGSSDDVTALGYDDSTNLLHVGTSSGRSDFQGCVE